MRLRILIIAAIVILPAHLPAQSAPICSPAVPCIQVCTGVTATSCKLTPLSSVLVQGPPGPMGPQGVPGPLIKGLTVSTDGLTLTWNGTFVTTGAGQGSITLDGFALTCKQASVGAAVPICTKQ